MKITFDPQAADDLAGQIDFLIERNAHAAARRLANRLTSFLETFLVAHPRTGKFISEAGLWETWIPGTKLVIWYRLTHDELQIVRIWHAARQR